MRIGTVKYGTATAFIATVAMGAIDMSRFSIDGGGGMRSEGGKYEISGTVGQPDAGALTGGAFTVTAGFWFETPPGDCNYDAGTGLSDVASIEGCMMGPVGPPSTGLCRCFDVDSSGHVDLSDFAVLQTSFSGH